MLRVIFGKTLYNAVHTWGVVSSWLVCSSLDWESGFNPWLGTLHWNVFLDKTLYSHNATPRPPRCWNGYQPVLSISSEVDVPTEKVGGSLLFECQRGELPRGVWEHAPQKVLKFRCLEMQFSPFSRQYLGLIRTIEIKYVYYSRSFPQNLNHWLLEKSEGGLGAFPPENFEIEMPGNVFIWA